MFEYLCVYASVWDARLRKESRVSTKDKERGTCKDMDGRVDLCLHPVGALVSLSPGENRNVVTTYNFRRKIIQNTKNT